MFALDILIARYFIVFNAIVNGIFSLLVYKSTLNFFMFDFFKKY